MAVRVPSVLATIRDIARGRGAGACAAELSVCVNI